MNAKIWIEAMRLRTLPLAIAHITMGSVLAAFSGEFAWNILVLTVATAVSLQILSNLANDYGDAIHGADHSGREGPQRAVSSGSISTVAMRRALFITAGIALILGLFLIFVSLRSWWTLFWFLLLGLICIWAAINYTAGKTPYGYRGLGDISVFIFFGLVAVVGSYFLQTRAMDWTILLPATSCGLLSIGVLNINNIRDIESDRKAGKLSIPVKIGREKAVIYHHVLLTASILTAVVYTIIHFSTYWQFLFLGVIPLLWINARAVHKIHEPMRLDPFLKQLALTNVLFVTTFAVGLLAFSH